MTYVPAWPALVMNRFWPSMTQVPPSAPSSRRAVVRVPPASEPARRLGEPVGADAPAPEASGVQPPVALLVRARDHQRPAAEARVGGDDQPERPPDAADLLDRDRVGERVHPGAAPALRDVDPEPAELADPAHDLDREAALALVLVDDRRDLGLHELADRCRAGARGRATGRGPSAQPSSRSTTSRRAGLAAWLAARPRRWARTRPRARWPRSAAAGRATGSRGGRASRARRGCRS